MPRAGPEFAALDIERQDRGRHRAQSPQPGLVHAQSRHSQRRSTFPRVDQACTRDFGLIVTDGTNSSPKRNALYLSEPSHRTGSTCLRTDQHRHCRAATESKRKCSPILGATWCCREIRFVPLQGDSRDYHVYALLASHLANFGYGNTGWVGDYKGTPNAFCAARLLRAGAWPAPLRC